MVFLDPNAESLIQRNQFGTTIPAGVGSDMPGLLSAWGIEYDKLKVLTDAEMALRVMLGQGSRPVSHLGMLGVQRNGLTQDDIITSRLESINVSSAGAISPAETATTRFEPLLQSSNNAMLMNVGTFQDVDDPAALFDEFESANQRFTIAARVSGKINSAFPDGPPAVEEESDAEADSEAAADPERLDEIGANPDSVALTMKHTEGRKALEEEEQRLEHLATSAGEVNLIVFADTDVLGQIAYGFRFPSSWGNVFLSRFANNGDFVVNSLDNLSGGADLVSIRSRGRYSGPLRGCWICSGKPMIVCVRRKLYCWTRLSASEETLNELSQDEEGNPILQITPEVQQEIDRVNAEILETRRRLRDVRFQLNADIERLGANLKLINTALVPVLLTIAMLVLAWFRSRRRNQQPV